ncbi:hypothetical protein TorRG33x02_086620 [Trema orientale]|uniref:Uncharacterized protein n=1 Tax=Trema orientale TaxID=63057 RepID=A0A2P5FCM4_TREOI|nr:hypothetical protein TorRG33x02_086620 [Trema orientale]
MQHKPKIITWLIPVHVFLRWLSTPVNAFCCASCSFSCCSSYHQNQNLTPSQNQKTQMMSYTSDAFPSFASFSSSASSSPPPNQMMNYNLNYSHPTNNQNPSLTLTHYQFQKLRPHYHYQNQNLTGASFCSS